MSKLLIHIGPPKTGTTQLQRLFWSNSRALNEKSITHLTPKLKEPIRSYFRAYRAEAKKPLSSKSRLHPWYLNCPESNFIKQSAHNYGVLSEEALFKLFRYEDELSLFDQFLSNWYTDRTYLTVLREVNGYTTSQLSQAIKGVFRFDYRQCQGALKRFSLDQLFAGIVDTDLSLEIATFGDLVAGSQSTINVSSVLESVFGISQLKLNKAEGVRNKSLGAEGTAIRLAYNNIMRIILGEAELKRRRVEIRNFGRLLQSKIMDQFSKQRIFCPYTKNEQSKFYEIHLAQSQRFISQFSGPWMDEVFTPVIREKSIALISGFEIADRKIAVDILESHIHEFLDETSLKFEPVALPQIDDAITFFLKNEKTLVL